MKLIQLYRSKYALLRSETDRILIWSNLFSMALVACRIIYTGTPLFVSMIWNLFLACIPYYLLKFTLPDTDHTRITKRFVIVFIPWLLFVPNTFYMITDLFHLYRRENIPIWFDLVLLMSFAWNGVMLGFLSIRQMEKSLATRLPGVAEKVFVPAMMLLNSFGVYLGRFLRFNSWDIVSNPLNLIGDIFALVFNPVQFREAWAMIFAFGILMTLIYQMLKRLSRELK